MPPTSSEPELRLDPVNRSAWIGATRVEASDLSFRVLESLAEVAPQPVSLECLKLSAWGLEVSDDAVKQRIKILRRALEAANAPGILATDRGRGYRLTRPAILIEPASMQSITAAPAGPYRHRLIAAAAMTGLAALVLVFVIWAVTRPLEDDTSRVAILPFSASPQDATWLASGLELELASAIARIDGFQSVSRTSSHALADQRARAFRRQLDADVLLDGHVSEDGNGFRIRVQLIDTARESQIWSSEYFLPDTQLNAVLADITTHIALIVHGTGGSALYERMLSGPTSNVGAYEEYITARAYLDRRSATNLQIAEAHFRAALERDRDFTMARAWLSYTLTRRAEDLNSPDLARQALAEADAGLSRQPDLAEAQLARAEALAYLGETEEAERLREEVRHTTPYLIDFMGARR